MKTTIFHGENSSDIPGEILSVALLSPACLNFLLATVTGIPEGVVAGFQNFAWAPKACEPPHYETFGRTRGVFSKVVLEF
jgi:hypothetical protein